MAMSASAQAPAEPMIAHLPGYHFVKYLIEPTDLDEYSLPDRRYRIHMMKETPSPDPNTKVVLKLQLTSDDRNAEIRPRMRIEYITMGNRNLDTPTDRRTDFNIIIPNGKNQRVNFFASVIVRNHDPDDRVIACLCQLVRMSPENLLSVLRSEPEIPVVETINMVMEKLQSETESGVQTLNSKWIVPLKCPIGLTSMMTPCRGRNCQHVACFDALNFFQVNQRIKAWKCPICGSICEFEDLRVDEYCATILESINYNPMCDYATVNIQGELSVHFTVEVEGTHRENSPRLTDEEERQYRETWV